ncbi:hypothetical protein [Kiloniella antarctica]|uniref:Uncharacterized protein n=1 Tax=Kiloniella antarctica TaxID=1550907 RepID=A0ABW5BHF8_9PROT
MVLAAKAGRKTGTVGKKPKLKGVSPKGNYKAMFEETVPQEPEVIALKVRAIALGYYGAQLREEGDAFELRDKVHFSSSWMEKA